MGPGMYLNPILHHSQSQPTQPGSHHLVTGLACLTVRAADQGPLQLSILQNGDQCCRTELPVAMETHPGEEPLVTGGWTDVKCGVCVKYTSDTEILL